MKSFFPCNNSLGCFSLMSCFALTFLFIFMLCIPFLEATTNQLPYLWPYPSDISHGDQTFSIQRENFQWVFSKKTLHSETQDILKDAIQLYKGLVFWHEGGNHINNGIPGIKIDIENGSSKPILDLKSDERYSLEVRQENQLIELHSKTVWGALRGLETLSQIIHFNSTLHHYTVTDAPLIIKDQPLYPWRGMLVDTARHYLSVDTLLHIIDSLAFNKMNVMHWHAVDAQSFPLEIRNRPGLSRNGAYASSAVYSPSDVRRVVQHGKKRGVRVVMETDIPGHTASWGHAYPDAVAHCPKLSAENVNLVALNPTHNITFDVVRDVIRSVSDMMLDSFIHLGGDEVHTQCWASDDQIVSWMKKQGWGSDWDRLWAYFEKQVQPLWEKSNKTVVSWEELLLDLRGYSIPKQNVIQAWKTSESLLQVTSRGYRAIQSYGWYLDKMTPGGKHHYLWGDTWKTFYNNPVIDSEVGNWTPKMKQRVLGGEACMWGEQVDDVNFDVRVWPRASAVAERLWSPSSVDDVSQAGERIQVHRCRLVRRDIHAGPLQPGYCAQVY